MAGRIEQSLTALGLTIPSAAAPVANYVPWVRTGALVYVSGQLPLDNGAVAQTGRLGEDVSVDQGYAAARLCALNLIAQLKAACGGDLDRVRRVVKLTGFVACAAGFTEHPQVINGASDLMVKVFGDMGRHARAAVGAPSLPRGASVEVEAVFEVE
jgi:enamine deaminase RidA (YjgF/YER057c/UK114 family)